MTATEAPDLAATAFARLHPAIQRWIHDKGWPSLREIQARAVHALMDGQGDAIIAAATAAGKTEAAFLPVLSLVAEAPQEGFAVMYVGPLKALINDQFLRVEELCERLELPVVKWHGDAGEGGKRQARERPAGVLLITPESLEALFVRRPTELARMLGRLRFVVIDELHAFLNSERGVHLASLLKRLEGSTPARPRRIGLSATIGDLALAAAWLRPDAVDRVTVLEVKGGGAELRLQLRGVLEPADADETPDDPAVAAIAAHLFATLRARGNHLVFGGSRRMVEALADRLRATSEAEGVPNEFFPHHGSLSRDQREMLEQRLKAGDLPTTAVATTTLEMGIDIGSVESIAEVGAPRAIAGLRQRVGRSGRRAGKPAILRLYVIEPVLDEQSSLLVRLRVPTVQAVAAIRLLLERWIEPPVLGSLHLSTLLHQVLATIVQTGGIDARSLFARLCGPGPFAAVTPALFAMLLRGIAATEPKLLEQAPDGTLMLGPLGERLTGSYEFFAVFATPKEFRLVTDGRALGTLSTKNALGADDYVTFGGRRWQVKAVDDRAAVIEVAAAPAGRVPVFEGGEPAPLHDRLVAEMLAVYRDPEMPGFLDEQAKRHLEEGRAAFRLHGLDRRFWVAEGEGLVLFPWVGSTALETLRLACKRQGFAVLQDAIALSLQPKAETTEDAMAMLRRLGNETPPSALDLAAEAETLESAKFDHLLPRDLLRQAFATDRLVPDRVPPLCAALSGAEGG